MKLLYSVWFAILSFGLLFVSLGSFYVVHPGESVIRLRLGKIHSCETEAGTYFKLPLVDSLVHFDTRIQKASIETTALTKDLQFVSTGITLNYRILDVVGLYQNVGKNIKEIIIDPFAQETIKAVVAKFTAENLIQYRHEAKDLVASELKERLQPLSVLVIDFNFVHLDFSADFIKAVEHKQIALQESITAKNYTEKVKEEALQKMKKAEAEAYALKVKRENLTPELIELIKIEKWDGVLPKVSGNTTPLISVQ